MGKRQVEFILQARADVARGVGGVRQGLRAATQALRQFNEQARQQGRAGAHSWGQQWRQVAVSVKQALAEAGRGPGVFAGLSRAGAAGLGGILRVVPAVTAGAQALFSGFGAVVGVLGTVGSVAASVFGTMIGVVGSAVGAVLRLAGAMGGALLSASRSVLGVLAAIAGIGGLGALTGAFAMLARQGISVNTVLQQTSMGLTTMLRSAGEAARLMAALRKEATKSAFEFVDLASWSKRMLAFGFATREVIPLIRTLGDTVAGLGGGREQLERLITAFGQIRAKGRLMGEEALQLTEAGIPVREILRVPAGVDIAQMGLSAEQAIARLAAGLQQRFGGMQRQLTGTLPGILSNIKDAINEISAAVTSGLYRSLTRAARAVQEFLGSLDGTQSGRVILASLTAGFDAVGKAVERAAGMLPALSAKLAAILQSERFARFKQATASAFEAMRAGAGKALAWVSSRWQMFTGYAGKLVSWIRDHWGEAWKAITEFAQRAAITIGGVIGGIVGALRYLWQAHKEGEGPIKAVAQWLKNAGATGVRVLGALTSLTLMFVQALAQVAMHLSVIQALWGRVTGNEALRVEGETNARRAHRVGEQADRARRDAMRTGMSLSEWISKIEFGSLKIPDMGKSGLGKAIVEGYGAGAAATRKLIEQPASRAVEGVPGAAGSPAGNPLPQAPNLSTGAVPVTPTASGGASYDQQLADLGRQIELAQAWMRAKPGEAGALREGKLIPALESSLAILGRQQRQPGLTREQMDALSLKAAELTEQLNAARGGRPQMFGATDQLRRATPPAPGTGLAAPTVSNVRAPVAGILPTALDGLRNAARQLPSLSNALPQLLPQLAPAPALAGGYGAAPNMAPLAPTAPAEQPAAFPEVRPAATVRRTDDGATVNLTLSVTASIADLPRRVAEQVERTLQGQVERAFGRA